MIPLLECSKLLQCKEFDHPVVMLLMRSSPKNEFRIPIINKSNAKINCEFKMMQGGYNADMHSCFVMPSRFGIPPGEEIKLMLTIKYNIQTFDEEQFKKKKEMRKILNVKIKDTKINRAFPLVISILSPNNGGNNKPPPGFLSL